MEGPSDANPVLVRTFVCTRVQYELTTVSTLKRFHCSGTLTKSAVNRCATICSLSYSESLGISAHLYLTGATMGMA